MLPKGVIPRLELLACGWSSGDDKLLSPTDPKWKALYPRQLWEPLATWAVLLDKANLGGSWAWDQDVADANPAALTRALGRARDDLDAIVAAKWDLCWPWIPSTKAGTMPVMNMTCSPRVDLGPADPTKVVTRPPAMAPWWVWLGLAYLIGNATRSK